MFSPSDFSQFCVLLCHCSHALGKQLCASCLLVLLAGQNCASQYALMLEKVATPKRKRGHDATPGGKAH